MLDVNVVALSIVTRESIALMRANDIDDGHVININSMSGHRLTSNSMYGASKFAVTALTEGKQIGHLYFSFISTCKALYAPCNHTTPIIS